MAQAITSIWARRYSHIRDFAPVSTYGSRPATASRSTIERTMPNIAAASLTVTSAGSNPAGRTKFDLVGLQTVPRDE